MTKKDKAGLRTWIEIDTRAIKHNYETFRKILGKESRFLAVVKSNAYGHGIIETSQFLQKIGVDWFGVDSIVEALALRREGITKPILVLGYTLAETFSKAQAYNISLTLSTFDSIKELTKLAKELKQGKQKLKVHLKIDTGMHRQGFYLGDLPDILKQLAKLNFIEIEGIYSHLAAPEVVACAEKTKKQIALFAQAAAVLETAGLKPIKHLMAAPGLLAFPSDKYDMARIGVGLYGLWPARELSLKWQGKASLAPVLVWKTIISEIKLVKKGESVGYGFAEILKRDSKIAICPIGYWHGYPRHLSNVGPVEIRKKLARVLGRVSMDMITIDVTDIPQVKVRDEVILFGGQVSAENLAKICDTIPYEIVTRINPLIKRLYR
jgi:alanine racemase